MRKLICLFLIGMVAGFGCYPNTYLYFADVFVSCYPIDGESARVEFMAGVYSHNTAGFNEKKTKRDGESLVPSELMKKAWNSPTAYEKGVWLHHYMDAKCAALLKESVILSDYSDVVNDRKLFFMVLDELIYNKRRCAFARNALLDVATDEVWAKCGSQSDAFEKKGKLLEYFYASPAVWVRVKQLDVKKAEIMEKLSKSWAFYDFMHLLHQSVNHDLAEMFFNDKKVKERLENFVKRGGE